MVKKLTNQNQTSKKSNGTILDRTSKPFRLCIQECLDNNFSFKKMKKDSLKKLDQFIENTTDKHLSITEVDELFLRTKGPGKQSREVTIKGIERQVFHYGKDRDPFRIFGYFNEDGYFVVYRIDPNHKTDKQK
ncbi:MAG: hypothetical protein L0L95_14150 [Staphylococcus equorum]|nr:hypothetical protein [Tetragenococcus koreensis]MDN6195484.1 hypothetical protein [Atopostipes suicloacalis]MDN6268584.1 hypothetical protein [Tetragenococcus koreensis]MDN6751382.1 hypothetical protein [Staphylococcus equorum]